MKKKRNTIQKIAVREYIKSVRTHPTAEEIYQELKKRYPTITLSTIYRNLNEMIENREVLVLKIKNESHFDGFTHFHLHFVCEKCRRIEDVEVSDKIAKEILTLLQEKDFRINTHSLISYGICNKCRR